MTQRVAVSDEQLLQELSSESFGVVYDRHVQRVYRHCARQLAGAPEAEDAVAMVFLEAWRRREAIRFVEGSALPWLLVVATNVTLNLRRTERRHRRVLARLPRPDAVLDHSERVAQSATIAANHQALASAMSALNRTDRDVVSLCLVGELTYAEAGAVLGLSHAAVRSRLSRARAQLRTALISAGVESSILIEGGRDDSV